MCASWRSRTSAATKLAKHEAAKALKDDEEERLGFMTPAEKKAYTAEKKAQKAAAKNVKAAAAQAAAVTKAEQVAAARDREQARQAAAHD